MSGKYLCVNLHLVWSTKDRRALIHPQWANRLYSYLGGIAQSVNAKLIAANGMPDHVHLYTSMPSTITIADLINTLKTNSSRWIHQTFPDRRLFSWQAGYAAFSVSRSREHRVIEYIGDQQVHHRKRDFQEELIELLNRHGIEYDPRYVFN
jgi:putative transposase